MIEVTGAKDGSTPAEAGANKYDFINGEKVSRLPLIVAFVITGIAGYLRTAFPDLRWPGQAAEPPAPDQPERATPVVETSVPADDPSPDAPKSLGFAAPLEASGDIYGRFGNNVIAFPGPKHTLIDSPPFQFEPPPAAPDIPLGSVPAAVGSAAPAPGVPAQGGGEGGDTPTSPARRNRAPEGPSVIRLNEAVAGGVLLIGLDQLLDDMADQEGDTLEVRNIVASQGSIARTSEGFVYSSNAAALPTTVMVTYEVSDGQNVVTRTALIPLVRGVMAGTPGDDMMLGTVRADQIDGGDGADMIDAQGGNDYIVGGDGDDSIVGGAGDDVVMAGAGNDVVFGGDGDDIISGGLGNDRLHGDAGDDVLSGDEGDDDLFGGAGADLLFGGADNDHLDGSAGDDLMDGGAGEDVLEDGTGRDRVFGGDGDDLVLAAKDADDDHFEGGEGEDTLDYSNMTVGIAIDMTSGTATSADTGTDTFSGFEALVGGAGADVFTIAGEAVRLTGGDGEDTFVFELSKDVDRPTLIHDILDFVTGDRIKVAAFEFSMDERDDEDRFERYYRNHDDDEDDEDALELRIRHRHDEDGTITVFEFDGDGDFEFEMTVAVHGYHQPFVYENTTA